MYITCTYVILISVFSVGLPREYILNNCNTHMLMHTCAYMSFCSSLHTSKVMQVCVCLCAHPCACVHIWVCVHLCIHVYHNFKKKSSRSTNTESIGLFRSIFWGQDSLVQETSWDKTLLFSRIFAMICKIVFKHISFLENWEDKYYCGNGWNVCKLLFICNSFQ